MDEHKAIEFLSSGSVADAEQIRRLIAQDGRFNEVFWEYVAAAAFLEQVEQTSPEKDALTMEYRTLVSERAVELDRLRSTPKPTGRN